MSRTNHARGWERVGRMERRTKGKPKIQFMRTAVGRRGHYRNGYTPSFLARLESKSRLREESDVVWAIDLDREELMFCQELDLLDYGHPDDVDLNDYWRAPRWKEECNTFDDEDCSGWSEDLLSWSEERREREEDRAWADHAADEEEERWRGDDYYDDGYFYDYDYDLNEDDDWTRLSTDALPCLQGPGVPHDLHCVCRGCKALRTWRSL